MNRPVVMLTMRGAKTGGIRKVPLMRVEHEGVYAAVASQGGAPKHPQWYAQPQGRPAPHRSRTAPSRGRRSPVRSAAPNVSEWWERCVAAYPPYADYQTRTDRLIPVLPAGARAGSRRRELTGRHQGASWVLRWLLRRPPEHPTARGAEVARAAAAALSRRNRGARLRLAAGIRLSRTSLALDPAEPHRPRTGSTSGTKP